MLDAWFNDFSHYLRTGSKTQLQAHFNDDADLRFAAIYRNGYLRACRDALASNFPTVVSRLGEDPFSALARQFIDTHPCDRRTLLGYGSGFAEFLLLHPSSSVSPWLADLARMDQAWLNALFAATPNSEKDVASFVARGEDIANVVTKLPAHARLVSTQYRVTATWLASREDGQPTADPGFESGTEQLLFWRNSDGPQLRLLEPAEAAFISAVADETTLEDAAEQALILDPALDISQWFATLLQQHLLEPA